MATATSIDPDSVTGATLAPTRGLRLEGGAWLGPEGVVPGPVILRGGVISDQPDESDRVLAINGLWVLPGIVDLHGDGFERHLAPRRGMVSDLQRGLAAVEADLVQNGITTAWLAQFWSWEGGMRSPDFAQRVAVAMAARRPDCRIDMRLQLRFETHMTEDGAAVRDLVAAKGIDYVVFNDHLPHDRLVAQRTPPRLTGSALKAGRAPEAHLAEMQRLHDQRDNVPNFLAQMARDFAANNVQLGSHDDPDAETRARWGAMGVRISEFPTTRAAAEQAHGRGDPVIMGAPNVVRGGSHDRRVAAEGLIADGLVSALASDYHYPALLDAAFALDARGTCSFSEAWRLISSGPANVLGLTDRGYLEPNARGDVVLVDPKTRRVVGCFAAGRPVGLRGDVLETAVFS